MFKLTKDQIKEVAEQLEIGFKCYINKEDGTLQSVPDFDRGLGGDEEPWADVIEEVEDNWEKYIKVDGMESRDSFIVMADFAEYVDNDDLRESLIKALNRKHPFQNFKWVIDNSGDYRQQWFDFKSQKYIEWVEDQLKVTLPDDITIPFQTIDWTNIPKTSHEGESGIAYWQSVQFPGLRIRIVEYSAGYLADHWCQKGHIVHCLEGEFNSELDNGDIFNLKKGMTYVVSDDMGSHRSNTKDGVKLMIIDGDFLNYRK